MLQIECQISVKFDDGGYKKIIIKNLKRITRYIHSIFETKVLLSVRTFYTFQIYAAIFS